MLPFHPFHGHTPVRHCRGYDRCQWYRRRRHRFRDHLVCHRAVESRESPIFFIEIEPPTHLPSLSTRKDVENQVRHRFLQLSHLVRAPKLYGVSAIGRQLSYYTYERASGTVGPIALADSITLVVDTAPIGRWNTNIMEEEGRAKFLAVVEEIKQMVAIIGTGFMYSQAVVQPSLTSF